MELLKNAILERGYVVGGDILKVDSFLNHQLDIELLNEIGKEFSKKFEGESITKILTAEVSGIAIASIAAQYFKVPVVFAKKSDSKNIDAETFDSQVYSYTKGRYYTMKVSRKYLDREDKILIIDDFMANGKAASGLLEIIEKSGAKLVGIGVVIEKGFQTGGDEIRSQGIRVESLAVIDSMGLEGVTFRE
ncbi:MAG: xanthine phosphoribosyltransferase [Gudongella sp.]|nr:xanthine phosphoribosyltransferase [Gudongella sp.]